MHTLLAIDDKYDNLIVIQALAKNLLPDTTVLTAASGQKGMDIARRELPDVILLDLVMPGMDGYETCSRLKSDDVTKHSPIIILTAVDTDSESRVRALNAGAEAFLTKPVDEAELVAQVKAMLRIKQAEDLLRNEKDVLASLVEKQTRKLQVELEERKQTEEDLKHALEASRRREREVSALLHGAKAVLQYHDFQETAKIIFDQCKELLGATAGYVALLSDEGDENDVLFLDSGGLPCTVDPELPMPIRGLRAEAYHNLEAVYDNEFSTSKWMECMPQGHVDLHNVLFAPLIIHQKAVGLLGLANKPGGFTERDKAMAAAFGELAAIALFNSRNLEELESALEENETLLREIHHRVKNNLQVISSLLYLQEEQEEDEHTRVLLKRNRDRIQTMSIVHEQLYQHNNLSAIDMAEYLEGLVIYLYQASQIDARRIALHIDVEPVRLHIEQAVPFGLLAQELLSNVFEHAFPDGRTGELNLHMHEEQEHCVFRIHDTGISLPETVNMDDPVTMGLDLVNSFTTQLRGTLELDRTGGTTFTLRFPK